MQQYNTQQTPMHQPMPQQQQNQIQVVTAPPNEIIVNLDSLIQEGIASTKMPLSIERSMKTAVCISKLRAAMTPQVMAPIMQLQNSSLGFRTDGNYSEDVVKDALISAFMAGLMPVGNMWNIIAKRFYVTKEGFTHLLKKMNLAYEIDYSIPEMKTGGAIVTATIKWRTDPNGEWETKQKEFPIRVNSGMGADAVLGKADRKAKAWLYNHLNQNAQLLDGDANSGDEYTSRPMRDATPKQGSFVRRKPAPSGVGYNQQTPEPEQQRINLDPEF